MAELTPMMKQYFQVKEQYPDTILMFRLGDFYEMFFDDAKTASAELELVLTGRDCGQEERAPMCGVPFHSADSYIARLVAKGYKVAICEQLEDPALAKGIVKRDVTRVLTPGTVIESTMLDESKNNFLACVFADKSCVGLCFADISTGSVHATQFERKNSQRKIINELGRFSPSELIINSAVLELSEVTDFVKNRLRSACDLLDDECFDPSKASASVIKHFKVSSLSDLSLDGSEGAIIAVGAAMDYLKGVQKSELSNIKELDFYGESSFMRLDVSTLRNLEITETMRNREKRGSLLWVLDKTKTSMGKRILRSWLEQPLLSIAKITKRHIAVGELVDNPTLRNDVIEAMTGCQDIERLITRIAYSTANARELRALSSTLNRLPQIKALISGCRS
ncbi:MAG: DNA mismatch repair protein MutS, partial [Acutalibacteraceae bacterium]